MEYFAGLDVSMEETHVCVVTQNGAFMHEVRVPSTSAVIAATLAQIPACRRVLFEIGRMAPMFYHGLSQLGLPVACVESRQAYHALKLLARHKTDRNDARGLAHRARTGFFKPVHVKSLPAHALFQKGMPIRREVLDPEYVDASMARADEFMMSFQRATTAGAWGWVWGDATLDRKTRSLMNLAVLTALNRAPEIKLHVKGALNNGVTVEEIKAALLHATAYCGIPAGVDAFRAAHEVLVTEGALSKP